MRRLASLALVSLLAACGGHADGDASGGASASATPGGSGSSSGPRVVAQDTGLGYCGTFYSFCPMFVLGDRVFFRAMTAAEAPGPFVASIRSANADANANANAPTSIVANADDASNLFGPFVGGDGVEWVVQSADTITMTLFTADASGAGAHALRSIAGAALVAGDDARAIYLFMADSTLLCVAKSNGDVRVVGALDGFVPIAVVADSDDDGFLYATGLGGIARLSKSNALLATLSTNGAGVQFGDRLSVGADQLFAAEETSSASAILARPLIGGPARTIASSVGGASSIVVDGDDVYWIAVSPAVGAAVSSAVWRAPLAGGGTPTQLYAEARASSWLTGVAFDAAAIYVTTSDGRLLALAK